MVDVLSAQKEILPLRLRSELKALFAQNDRGRGTEDGGRGMSNPRTRANRNYVNPFVVFRRIKTFPVID